MAVFRDISAVVKSDIETGRLLPGTFLSQPKVCKLYGCGRTVARRVLRMLQEEGYVNFSLDKWAGEYVVAQSSDEMIMQGIELRAVLETYTAFKLLDMATPLMIDRLKRINQSILDCVLRDDLINAVAINQHLHLYMINAVDQGPLSRVFGMMFREASLAQNKSYKTLKEAFLGVCLNASIIDAIEMKNGERLRHLVKRYVFFGLGLMGRGRQKEKEH